MSLERDEKPDINAGLDVLKVWLFSCPEKEFDYSMDTVKIQNNIKDMQVRLDKLRNIIVLNISNEKDGNGKLVFTNQNLREAEADKRLNENEDYLHLVSELRKLYLLVEEAKAKRDYYSKMFRVVRDEVNNLQELDRMKIMKEMQMNKIEGFK